MAKKETEALQKVHTEALKRFEDTLEASEDQRKLSIEDIRFANEPGFMWEEKIRKNHKDLGKPIFEVNRIAPAIDRELGQQNKLEIGIKYRPTTGGATKEVAATMTGLARNIYSKSKGKTAIDNAVRELWYGGIGAFRFVTREDDDDIFSDNSDKEILYKPILSAASSYYVDANSVEPDESDARFKFITEFITIDAYEERFIGENVSDFDGGAFLDNLPPAWRRGELVLIAEYWRMVKVKKNLAKLSDGRVVDVDKMGEVLDELAKFGITIDKTKTVDTLMPEQYILSGEKVLSGPNKWGGRFIPTIGMYGYKMTIEGRVTWRGRVRFAKDPARINNYATSSMVEDVALSPKQKTWITKEQAIGNDYNDLNRSTNPMAYYNHVEGQLSPFPTPPAPVQPGMGQLVQQSIQDIHATLGPISQPTQPHQGTTLDQRSGRAVIEQARPGEDSSNSLYESVIVALEASAEMLADLMAAIYDGERQINIMNPDGTEEVVTINQTMKDDQTGKDVIVQDFSQGKYDYTVSTGPSFNDRRQEEQDTILRLIEAFPGLADISQDLLIDLIDIRNKDELHRRVRMLMIQQGTVQPNDDEQQEIAELQQAQGPQEPSPTDVLLQAEANKSNSEAQLNQAKTQQALADAAKKTADAKNVEADTYKKAVDAQGGVLDNIDKTAEMGLPLTQQDHDNRVGATDVVEEAQEEISPGLTSEQAAVLALENQQ